VGSRRVASLTILAPDSDPYRFLKGKLFEEVSAEAPEDKPEWRTWTDDYSNLVQILK